MDEVLAKSLILHLSVGKWNRVRARRGFLRDLEQRLIRHAVGDFRVVEGADPYGVESIPCVDGSVGREDEGAVSLPQRVAKRRRGSE